MAGAAVAGGAALAHHRLFAGPEAQANAARRQAAQPVAGPRRFEGSAARPSPQRPFANERQQAFAAHTQADRPHGLQQHVTAQAPRPSLADHRSPPSPGAVSAIARCAQRIVRAQCRRQSAADHAPIVSQHAFVAPRARAAEMHAAPRMEAPRRAPQSTAAPRRDAPHAQAPRAPAPRVEPPHVAVTHPMAAPHPAPAPHAAPPAGGGGGNHRWLRPSIHPSRGQTVANPGVTDMPSGTDIMTHSELVLRPDPARTVLRPFALDDPNGRPNRIVERVLGLDQQAVDDEMARVMEGLKDRHRDVETTVQRRFGAAKEKLSRRHPRRSRAADRRLFQRGIFVRGRGAVQPQHGAPSRPVGCRDGGVRFAAVAARRSARGISRRSPSAPGTWDAGDGLDVDQAERVRGAAAGSSSDDDDGVGSSCVCGRQPRICPKR